MRTDELRQMLALASEALWRADASAVAREAPIEDVAELLIACSRISVWQEQVLVGAAEARSEEDVARLRAIFRTAREASQQRVALMKSEAAGRA